MKNNLSDKILIYTPKVLGLLAFYLTLLKSSSGIPVAHEIIGAFLMIFGFLFWIASVSYLGGFQSMEIKPKVKLQTKGPYRIIRHPMFFSWILIAIGAEIFFQSLEALPILALFCLILILRARREEKYLEKKFGKQWKRYKKRVGFLIPRFKK